MFEKMKNWFESKKNLLETISQLKEEVERQKQNRVTVINKNQLPKDDPWHLIISDGKEYWVRPNRVSYVSPILDNGFSIIMDGIELPFAMRSYDEAIEFRNILLNINAIPAANTYERKKEPSEILKDIERTMPARKRITQEDVDNMDLKNVKK